MGAPPLSLRAMIFPEGREWVAHCLDLDLVETGAMAEAAMDALVEAVRTQFWYARTHDNFGRLFQPAPREAWQRFGDSPGPVSHHRPDGPRPRPGVHARVSLASCRVGCVTRRPSAPLPGDPDLDFDHVLDLSDLAQEIGGKLGTVRIARKFDMPAFLARGLLDLGLLSKREKRLGEARAHLEEARQIAEREELAILGEKIRQALGALGRPNVAA